MKDKKVCGRCNFCVKDDGSPYCVCKDLYTTVELNHKCDTNNRLDKETDKPCKRELH